MINSEEFLAYRKAHNEQCTTGGQNLHKNWYKQKYRRRRSIGRHEQSPKLSNSIRKQQNTQIVENGSKKGLVVGIDCRKQTIGRSNRLRGRGSRRVWNSWFLRISRQKRLETIRKREKETYSDLVFERSWFGLEDGKKE